MNPDDYQKSKDFDEDDEDMTPDSEYLEWLYCGQELRYILDVEYD